MSRTLHCCWLPNLDTRGSLKLCYGGMPRLSFSFRRSSLFAHVCMKCIEILANDWWPIGNSWIRKQQESGTMALVLILPRFPTLVFPGECNGAVILSESPTLPTPSSHEVDSNANCVECPAIDDHPLLWFPRSSNVHVYVSQRVWFTIYMVKTYVTHAQTPLNSFFHKNRNSSFVRHHRWSSLLPRFFWLKPMGCATNWGVGGQPWT